MESLKELYRIGPGPSSSHTLAIKRICEHFLSLHPNLKEYEIDLYGSLSLTGKGHMTDKIIYETLSEDATINFLNKDHKHPNTIVIKSNDIEEIYYSTGGGSFLREGDDLKEKEDIYPEKNMSEIEKYLKDHNCDLYQYILNRDKGIKGYLIEVFEQMIKTIENGLNKEGLLPGPLKLERVAKRLYLNAENINDETIKKDILITAYAYACAEENASGNTVTTAPTLGSCGVLPAVLYYQYKNKNISKDRIIEALAIGGIYGNIIKENATISGAKGGCQAEIGTACAMAAAALASLYNLSLNQISYAAEMGIEHHLGLTCDPIGGYVQIPCIERNGVGALRAYDAANYAKYLGDIRGNRISFDTIVETMNYTGEKIARELKETSLGGLAKIYKEEK